MDMQLTSDQVLAMAPDASSAAAGKKLGSTKNWKTLGKGSEALWGLCQGSGKDPYQVKIDLSSFTTQCSCPSRKFPCKHSLGLMLIFAADAASVPETEPPAWVADWLERRRGAATRKQAKAEKAAHEEPSAAQQKTAEKRLANVKKGVDGLDLWLSDLVRSGLASVSTQPASFWENQAARMRDAQASGLDSRLRRMASIPNSAPDWPEKLLAQVGKLALLTHAFRQEGMNNAGLQEDIRQMIGWNLTQEEVTARGEAVTDTWLFVGQTLDDEERVRVQRTWLYGLKSQRAALVLQFSVAGTPFPEVFALGSQQEAEVVFWPGAYPQRARLGTRRGRMTPLKDRLPGVNAVDTFLAGVAATLARQPWQERFLALLCDVTPVYNTQGNAWYVRDSSGNALRLASGDYWPLLAISGGHPVDIAGEWDGEALLPLGVLAEGEYTLLLQYP